MPTGIEGRATRTEAPSVERVAAAFPHLEILGLIGQGGMGCVFKARQPKLNRVVALKILPEELAQDAAFAARFTREAQALAALNHANIVTVHDFGQSGGFFFLLMEFVDGVNLRQALRAERLSPEQALAIVPPICEALQFAHERGIVHRDIKPENLLLDRAGRVKIADFGIARMIGAAPVTGEEKPVGTPHYIAPEQAANPLQADHRTDIYSLGVVLYEMLTGELPDQRLEPPSRKVQVDVRIDEVVLRALEKSPALRWQTAAEMQTQVETITASQVRKEMPSNEDRGIAQGSENAQIGKSALHSAELRTALLLCFPPALFAWFVLTGGHRGREEFVGFAALLRIDLDPDVLLWTSLIGFPLSAVLGALLAWAFGSWTAVDRQIETTFKRWSWLAVTAALLVALSIQLMGGGMAIASLLAEEAGGWNPGSNELVFTLLFVGGGVLTAFAGTLLGAIARKRIRERPAIGWGAASNAAWFWPGVGLIVLVLAIPTTLFRGRAKDTDLLSAAQLQAERQRESDLAAAQAAAVTAAVRLEEIPPVVVQTYPISGATDVPPGRTELRVRFSKPMLEQSWSWSTAWADSAPPTVGPAAYKDEYTCTITVELEPNRTYAYWLNSEQFNNFRDRNGQPAVPYLLIFRTQAAAGSPPAGTNKGE